MKENNCKKPRYRELLFSVPQTLTSLRLWEEKASIQRTLVLCPSNSYEFKVMGRLSCHDSGKDFEGVGVRSRISWNEGFIEDAGKRLLLKTIMKSHEFGKGIFMLKKAFLMP